MALFRAGNEEAFRVIHDRYRKRLLAYIRQMLIGSGQDVEDVLQDVLERAYCGLRATDRDLALKAWLYRVAHNRCIDQLRRPVPMATTAPDEAESRQLSPAAIVEQRETLRRLIIDVQRLPDQQRSALLLREMSGMSYVELAGSLGVSVPAVKSLLVRARIGLVAAGEARDTACSEIREELALCHDRGVRPSGLARRHLRDCEQCVHFKRSVRGVSRNLAAVIPAFGPVGVLVKLVSGGGAAGSGGMLGSSGAAGGVSAGGLSAGGVTAGGITAGGVTAGGVTAGGVTAGGVVAGGAAGSAAAGGAALSTSAVAGGFAAGTASHVATLVAAALVTAGGAVAVQQASTPVHSKPHSTPVHHVASAPHANSGGAAIAPAASLSVARTSVDSTLAASPGSPSAAAGTGSSGSAAHPRRAKLDPVSIAVSSSSSGTEAPSDPAVGSGDSSVITPTASPTSTVPSDTSSPDSSSSDSTDATAGTSSTTIGTASGTQSTGGAAITGAGATGGASASGSSSGS